VNSQEYKGDYAIVTTSAKTSASIPYEPPLSSQKIFALQTISYDSSTIVLLFFKTQF
jgi:monoamine oxidase